MVGAGHVNLVETLAENCARIIIEDFGVSHVRLKPGERYLKTIERGKSPTSVNLPSFNAKPITGVKLEWIGEICVPLPRGQIERLRTKAAGRARKPAAARWPPCACATPASSNPRWMRSAASTA